MLAAGGTAICLVNGAHPVAVGAGALAIYAGASRLLEPLRAETDQPGRVRVLLRAPIGKVLVQHALVPLVVVVIGALLAVAGCAARARCPTTVAPPCCSPCSPPPRSRSAPRSRAAAAVGSRRACSRPPTATRAA